MSTKGFEHARQERVAAAAAAVGVRPGSDVSDADLAHIAWHCGVVEPAELRGLLARGDGPWADSQSPRCHDPHNPCFDPLDRGWPLPHPLDYEWRFAARTRAEYVERVATGSSRAPRVALLGTPTLFNALAREATALLLIDRNEPLVRAVTAGSSASSESIVADIQNSRPPIAWINVADVTVCDPPWYGPALQAFISSAAWLTRKGGTVFVSVPDELVRPSVQAELAELLSTVEQHGLRLDHVERGVLRYETPFFEFRAQRAAGLRSVPLEWRVGTLWELTKIKDMTGPPSLLPNRLERAMSEHEVRLGTCRIRVLPQAVSTSLLSSLVLGDVLPTVSGRHEARSRANVWTSGNSVLATNNPGKVLRVLHAMSTLSQPVALRGVLDDVRDVMQRLVAWEADDLDAYGALTGDPGASWGVHRR